MHQWTDTDWRIGRADGIDVAGKLVNVLREVCNLVRRPVKNEQHIPSVEIQAVQGVTHIHHSTGQVTGPNRHPVANTMRKKKCLRSLRLQDSVEWLCLGPVVDYNVRPEAWPLVSEIKAQMPHIGYRLIIGRQWARSRMKAATAWM